MKNKLTLVLPNKKYLNSFANGIEEFRKEDTLQVQSELEIFKTKKDFPKYIEIVQKDKEGLRGRGFVPQTRYWAVVENKFVGILKLRHKLNKKLRITGGHIGYAVVPSERRKGYGTEMLRQGLKKANVRGIEKALLTCKVGNIASRKVIEANGGILEDKITFEGDEKFRFWVPTN